MNCYTEYVVMVCVLLQCFTRIQAAIFEVSLKDSMLCEADPFEIGDDDVVVGILKPRRTTQERVSCIIKVTAKDRTQDIIVQTKYLEFQGCGDRIKIYNQQRHKTNPIHTLDCDAQAGAIYNTYVPTAMVIYTKSSEMTTSVLEFWIMTENSTS